MTAPVQYTPGPFSVAHLYLQWGGTLPGGDEWSCGLRLQPVGQGVANNLQSRVDAAAAAVEAFHTNGQSLISSRAILTFTKLNAIGVNGRYIADTTLEHVHANVPGGGLDTRTPANQVTLVVSLLTGFSRGAAHRGRFYMPLPSTVVQADGRIATGDRDVVKTSATTFIAALNAIDAGFKVAVMSRKVGAAIGRNVTGVEVGRVLDTQRRRRNKLVEAY